MQEECDQLRQRCKYLEQKQGADGLIVANLGRLEDTKEGVTAAQTAQRLVTKLLAGLAIIYTTTMVQALNLSE